MAGLVVGAIKGFAPFGAEVFGDFGVGGAHLLCHLMERFVLPRFSAIPAMYVHVVVPFQLALVDIHTLAHPPHVHGVGGAVWCVVSLSVRHFTEDGVLEHHVAVTGVHVIPAYPRALLQDSLHTFHDVIGC